jgi:general secretion pathway protein D
VLASNNDLSVLSSPQVLVLNNETATINVGDQVPIVTSQFTDIAATSGTTGTANQTIQYKDTGIILNVTPRINYDGIILIDIDQQVSSVNETIKTGVNSPTISTKEVKTKLAVKNSQSILIGGLISHDRTNSESGIPFIKDVPVLGNLFKYQQEINNKKELLIMITPYVIENENVLDQYIEQFKQKTNELRHEIYGSTSQKSAAKSE